MHLHGASPAAVTQAWESQDGSIATTRGWDREPDLKALGRFQIVAWLGEGAFGTVYRARDPVLDRDVALKVPKLSAMRNTAAVERFLREPKAAARLWHPNIVPVHDAGAENGRYYIASAFIEGRTLEDELVSREEPFGFREAATIAHKLAQALDYAHRSGITHRDIKPSNVMLDADGEPLIMDFGLARIESEAQLTQDGSLLGTPAYMSPEQASRDVGAVGPASDQYSLGIVLYELLTGTRPFSGNLAAVLFDVIHTAPPNPKTLRPKLPLDLETICLKAIAKSPADRYQSCAELADDLKRWLDDQPIQARRHGIIERAVRWTKKNPLLAGLGAAVVALAVLSTLAAAGLYGSRQLLALSILNERNQTERAKELQGLAEAQAKEARDQKINADEQKKVAEKNALTAKQKAQEASTANEELRQLLAKYQEKEQELLKQSKALLTAEEQVRLESERAEEAAASSSWLSYIDALVAADQAWAEKDTESAVQLLETCPEEHRAWEWHYLKALCGGLSPELQQTRPKELLDIRLVSRTGQWVIARPLRGDTRLINLSADADSLRFPALDWHYCRFSPGGTFAWINRPVHKLFSLKDGKATVLPGKAVLERPSSYHERLLMDFTADDRLVVYYAEIAEKSSQGSRYLIVCNTDSGEVVAQLPTASSQSRPKYPWGKWTGNGKQVLVSGARDLGDRLAIWDPFTNQMRDIPGSSPEQPTADLHFSQNAPFMFLRSGDTVTAYDLQTVEQVISTSIPVGSIVKGVSPDGKRLIFAT